MANMNTKILIKELLEKYLDRERKEIAKILNINYVSIKRYIRKFGLKPKEKRHNTVIRNGRISIWVENLGKRVWEHRYVIEKHLNRKLTNKKYNDKMKMYAELYRIIKI